MRRAYNDGYVIIRCPSNQCAMCKGNFMPEQCSRIRDVSDEHMVVVIEPAKSTIYIKKPSDDRSGYLGSGHIFEPIYIEELNSIPWDCIIGLYRTGPYLSIFFSKEGGEPGFKAVPRIKSALEDSLVKTMAKKLEEEYRFPNSTRNTLNGMMNRKREWVSDKIARILPELRERSSEIISSFVAFESTPFGKIMPLILDENVEEIYADSSEGNYYFDHSQFGRVGTSAKIGLEEAKSICTTLRAESNMHLDRKNPSLKTEMHIQGVPLRISASISPLAIDGINLQIRRARVKPFTIQELIQNGTLTYRAAAILIICIGLRRNITITGEPGTGKTTLLNALDSLTPGHWRKIYIEDAIESRKETSKHQLRIRVSPLDEHDDSRSKSVEIVKSLHRSPDYVVLGEIQTKEHSKALFQSLAAGLRSIQTCHGNSSLHLVTRWALEHQIDHSSIGLMDIIVSMVRETPGRSRRHVSEIVEVCKTAESGMLSYSGLNTLYAAEHPDEIHPPSKNGLFRGFDFLKAVETISEELKTKVLDEEDHLTDLLIH